MIADLLLDPAARPVIAHRGASGLAPENTLAAFDRAAADGADAFELDVRLSADGVAVVIHDPTLDRTTDRQGAIEDLTVAQLQAGDAGARFSPDGATFPFRGTGVTIPTFAAVLERYPTMPLLVEIKTATAQLAVRSDLIRAGAQQRVVLASFHHEALAAFRTAAFLVGASRRDIAALAVAARLGLPWCPRGPRCFAVPDRYRDQIEVPTPRFVAAAHRAARPVHVWTVNEAERAGRLWDRGVNGIISNFPAVMQTARSRLPPGSSSS